MEDGDECELVPLSTVSARKHHQTIVSTVWSSPPPYPFAATTSIINPDDDDDDDDSDCSFDSSVDIAISDTDDEPSCRQRVPDQTPT